jgi:hypothetical protein
MLGADWPAYIQGLIDRGAIRPQQLAVYGTTSLMPALQLPATDWDGKTVDASPDRIVGEAARCARARAPARGRAR